MLESLYTWLLLPLGAALGWVLARRTPHNNAQTPEHLGGLLTQLSASDPDQAIAALTQAVEMDSATAELHLTLGNLFRKRGEVDRALRIHEALLARPTLAPALKHRARFELAQDYLKAGLIDRAEALFEELAGQGLHLAASLEQILAINEQGRDWKPAIETARRLESAKGESQRVVIAQYFCELAEEARQQNKIPEAIKLAQQALHEHKDCVRADLLVGALKQGQGEFAAAIKAYRQAFEHDPRFLPEIMTAITQSYEGAKDAAGYVTFLTDAQEISRSALPVIAQARLMREQGQDGMSYLASGLETHASRALLVDFLTNMQARPDVVATALSKPLASLRGALQKLNDASPLYRCDRCGFSGRQMFWQCPTCKQWNSLAPIEDVLSG